MLVIISILILYVMVMIICDKRDDAQKRLKNVNAELAERVKNQKEILNVLRRESDYDALTDIYNRRGGDKEINRIVNDRKRDGTFKRFKVVLATMDIDDFKSINDHYGHSAGDEALQHFAISLYNTFPTNSVPIRAGGDEFNLFLYGSSISEIEAKLLDFAKGTFRFEYNGKPISFHISCGYALFPTHADSVKELYRKADDTLYYVKMTGKHRAMRYSEDIDSSPRTQMSFMTRRISENLPIAYMVYRADDSEEILAVSKTLLAMCECDSFEDFMAHTGGTFRGFVHPDDVDDTEKSIHGQIATNRHGLDAVDYRIITKKGRAINVHDIGRLVNDETMGDLFYVVIYSEEISEMADHALNASKEKKTAGRKAPAVVMAD